ncbi:hypothetical protein BN871_HG_00020 [Paenibacillus sp. P22]|nr:hypothetical protein BN871_HG_00020 [Paenibacillus sp. P22]
MKGFRLPQATLRTRLIIGFAVVTAPLVILLLWNNLYSTTVVRSQVAQSNRSLLTMYMNDMDKVLEEIQNYLFKTAEQNRDLLSLSQNERGGWDYYRAKTQMAADLGVNSNYYEAADVLFAYSSKYDDLFVSQQQSVSFQRKRDIQSRLHEILKAGAGADTPFSGWTVTELNGSHALVRIVDTGYGSAAGAWVDLDRLMKPLHALGESGKGEAVLLGGHSGSLPLTTLKAGLRDELQATGGGCGYGSGRRGVYDRQASAAVSARRPAFADGGHEAGAARAGEVAARRASVFPLSDLHSSGAGRHSARHVPVLSAACGRRADAPADQGHAQDPLRRSQRPPAGQPAAGIRHDQRDVQRHGLADRASEDRHLRGADPYPEGRAQASAGADPASLLHELAQYRLSARPDPQLRHHPEHRAPSGPVFPVHDQYGRSFRDDPSGAGAYPRLPDDPEASIPGDAGVRLQGGGRAGKLSAAASIDPADRRERDGPRLLHQRRRSLPDPDRGEPERRLWRGSGCRRHPDRRGRQRQRVRSRNGGEARSARGGAGAGGAPCGLMECRSPLPAVLWSRSVAEIRERSGAGSARHPRPSGRAGRGQSPGRMTQGGDAA